MAQVIFPQSSKYEAYKKMNDFGVSGSYAKVGFTDFTVRSNFGLSDTEIYDQEMNNEPPIYSIVGYSTYHVESTIKDQYDGNW